ncbi:MAG: class I SAM-dependent methyltransferase [Planctomycetales bacterium]|nr:class I SAM-dependent methyltransferase [Planctomycetales bacterium]
MRRWAERIVRAALHRAGFDLVRHSLADFTSEEVAIIRSVKPYTMTSEQRVCALMVAVKHLIENGVPGAMVECGVWRGGSMMAVARTLRLYGDDHRELYLFDTFAGMTPPGRHDETRQGRSAEGRFRRSLTSGGQSRWCFASLDEVRNNMGSTGYDAARCHFIAGDVLKTLPTEAPQQIALLRLDTDFYESTKHSLACLYPRLVTGGVLLLDDYGWWRGARRAVDEYFDEHPPRPLLNRIDHAARIGIKPPASDAQSGE